MNFTEILLLPRTTRQFSEAFLPATLSAQTHFWVIQKLCADYSAVFFRCQAFCFLLLFEKIEYLCNLYARLLVPMHAKSCHIKAFGREIITTGSVGAYNCIQKKEVKNALFFLCAVIHSHNAAYSAPHSLPAPVYHAAPSLLQIKYSFLYAKRSILSPIP